MKNWGTLAHRGGIMVIWTLAKKDLRLLLRDARAMIILLAMPLIFILVLGVSLGEGFGKKAEDTLRVSVLILDEGVPRQFDLPAMTRETAGWLAMQPATLAGPSQLYAGAGLVQANHAEWFPHEAWSQLVIKDLRQTAGIRVELIESREQADELIRSRRRAAVLVLGPQFSKRVERCSFLGSGWRDAFTAALATTRPGDPVCLALGGLLQETQSAYPLYLVDGINPFYRDGVNLDVLDAEVVKDETQKTASAIIDQVAQGSLLRVIMPWMIGRAFERIGDPAFLALLGREEQLPGAVKLFLTSPFVAPQQRRQLSVGLQNSIQNLFPRYNLTAKTWAALTKQHEHTSARAGIGAFKEEGRGLLKRGAVRYQLLVPSYLVMFAFFLVLTVGWLFVAERRQGTMTRLTAAPVARWQILAGKLLPCLVLSLFQGFFILAAGRLVFDMSWGADPWWLVPLVAATSLAAMGLAMLIAAIAKTETQVAIYGTLLVLVLAGLSGCLMGDRELMPDQMQTLSLVTPHAWALNAYRELLTAAHPNLHIVRMACGVLAAFGVGFLTLAWGLLRLEA
jgi:ABC-type Na+ efflux pump permease subunit